VWWDADLAGNPDWAKLLAVLPGTLGKRSRYSRRSVDELRRMLDDGRSIRAARPPPQVWDF
jgi:hypothetical protein